MLIEAYLNQTATWTPAQRDADGHALTDSRSAVLYDAPQTITCRREDKAQQVLSEQRQVLTVERTYYTYADVRVDDLLDGRRVLMASVYVGFSGVIEGYKAVV